MANDLTQPVSYAPRSLTELDAFCQRITKSALVPKAYQHKPEDALVAIMHGHDFGIPPLASLQFIAVINGRPAFYGDAVAGVALKSGVIVDIDEEMEGTPGHDDWTAICTVTKPNQKTVTRRFSVFDAKKAQLWGKAGPWSQYPARMLAARARGFAVRDAAPHAFLGYTVEELRDIPDDEFRGPGKAKDVTPKPAPADWPDEHKTAYEAQQPHDPDTGEVQDDLDAYATHLDPDNRDPLVIEHLGNKELIGTLEHWLERDHPRDVKVTVLLKYKPRIETRLKPEQAKRILEGLQAIVEGKVAA